MNSSTGGKLSVMKNVIFKNASSFKNHLLVRGSKRRWIQAIGQSSRSFKRIAV